MLRLSRGLHRLAGKLREELFELGRENRDEFLTEQEMYTYKEKNFLDKVRIRVSAGKGGHGSVTHEVTYRGLKGRPNGGSGGNGGAVWIRAMEQEPDLSYIRNKHMKGNPGRIGTADGRNGANGKDIHVGVPVGTCVYELVPVEAADPTVREKRKLHSSLDNYKREFLADLSEKGQQVQVVKGGIGGQGNIL